MKTKNITKEDLLNNSFYQLPKFLFTENFIKMSNDSKILYAILSDRMQLSIKNDWIDETGDVFIIFTNLELQSILQRSERHIIKTKKELSNYGLLKEKRQGLNKPNMLYIRNLLKVSSRVAKKSVQEFTKSQSSNTDINKTDINKTTTTEIPEVKENKEVKEKAVVVESLLVKFNKKYGGNLDHNLLKNLIKIKGYDVVEKCIDEFENYIINANQVEKVFYDFCMKHDTDKAYKKNTAYKSNIVNNQPIQSTNYEQREYSDDYWDKFIKNKDTAL